MGSLYSVACERGILFAESGGGEWLGIIVILIIIGVIYGNLPVRCSRCRFRAKRSEFINGCCPSCGSKEEP